MFGKAGLGQEDAETEMLAAKRRKTHKIGTEARNEETGEAGEGGARFGGDLASGKAGAGRIGARAINRIRDGFCQGKGS